jgi:hypothetical protein
MIKWHLILNRSGARVFKTVSTTKPMRLVKAFNNPWGHEKNRSFQTDRPGAQKFRIRNVTVPHSMSGRSEPHEDIAIQFVREISRWIMKEAEKQNFETLMIFADPHVAGLLKPYLEDCKIPISWNHKNLSKFSDHEIGKMVHEYKRA